MDTVYLDGNAWTFEIDMRSFNAATGRQDKDDALSVQAWFAATEGGAEIDPALKLTLGLRAAGTGSYYNTLAGATITAKLAAYANTQIFEVYAVGTSFRKARAVRVGDVRREEDEG